MRPSKQYGTLRYAVIGAAIIAVAGGLLAFMHNFLITRELSTSNERNNIFLTRVFANIMWPEIRTFVATAHTLPLETLKAHPLIARTRAQVADMAKDVPLLKIKIFDLNGLTVFSTEAVQIGETKTTYPGFVSARSGKVASIAVQRDSFNAINGVVRDRQILSSYIPIWNAAGEVEGVFEIYADVTEFAAQLRNAGMLQLAVVGLTFLLLYEIALNLIRHRDRIIAETHAEQLRLMETAVAAEEASRTKSAFLANMSHELRTPLNAVIGFAETMRLQPFGPIGSPKYLTYLEDIWKSGRNLLDIVENVLEMARIDDGNMKLHLSSVPVSDLVDSVIRLADSAPSAPRAPIRAHLPGTSVMLLIDEKRVRQVLAQLVSNARKFTPPHGSIEISARWNRAGRMEIAVTDTGIGMAPEDIGRVLVPFNKVGSPYAHSSSGPRLGLPLARMIMELHGGTLTIESVLGKGTCVTVVFAERSIVYDDGPVIASSYSR
jgi:signal transduction histidine kinase